MVKVALWLCSGPCNNDVRLVGSNTMEGRLEVCPLGATDWRTVCTNFFGFEDAAVVCRQLGFSPLGKAKFLDL